MNELNNGNTPNDTNQANNDPVQSTEQVNNVVGQANIEENTQPTVANDKKKKTSLIIIIVIAFLLIGGCLFVVFGTDLLKDKNNEVKEQEENHNVVQKEDSKKFAGKYKYVDEDNYENTLKIYPLENGKFFYTLNGNGFFQGKATVSGKVGKKESSHFDEVSIYEFTLNDDNSIHVKVTDNGKVFIDATYTKESGEYMVNEVFDDMTFIDDISKDYFNTKYNGIYKLDNNELTMFQFNENTVEVDIVGSSGLYSKEATIVSDGKLEYVDEEGSGKMTIELDNGSLKLEIVDGDEDFTFRKFSGTYKKEKEFNLESFVNYKLNNLMD